MSRPHDDGPSDRQGYGPSVQGNECPIDLGGLAERTLGGADGLRQQPLVPLHDEQAPFPGDSLQFGDAGRRDLHLSYLNPGPNFDPEGAEALRHGDRALDGVSGLVEGREEPIAGGIHLPPVVTSELPTDHSVVPGHELTPGPVTEFRSSLRRARRCR